MTTESSVQVPLAPAVTKMIPLLSPEHQAVVQALVYDLAKLEQLENGAVGEDKMNCSQTTWLRLTPRKKQILTYAAEGYSDKRIAYQLGLNEGTVKNHLAEIRSTLSALNRAHAIAIALTQGLISRNHKGNEERGW
jgi:DNA-binding NarL/FixJ family response regulator